MKMIFLYHDTKLIHPPVLVLEKKRNEITPPIKYIQRIDLSNFEISQQPFSSLFHSKIYSKKIFSKILFKDCIFLSSTFQNLKE